MNIEKLRFHPYIAKNLYKGAIYLERPADGGGGGVGFEISDKSGQGEAWFLIILKFWLNY